MQRILVFLLVLTAGCTKPTLLPAVTDSMTLTSKDFADGQAMPDRFGAKGADVSPSLSWTGAPKGTKSFALIVQDPDAPGPSPFVHWVLFNIPASFDHLDEGSIPAGAISGRNDAGTTGYFGPKPPSGTHHYVFRIYALDKVLNLKPGATEPELLQAMKNHELGMGKLTGLYSH